MLKLPYKFIFQHVTGQVAPGNDDLFVVSKIYLGPVYTAPDTFLCG